MTGKIRVHTSLCDGRLIGNGNLPDNKGTWKLFIKIDGEEPEWFIVCVSHMIRKTGGNPLALPHVLKNATFCFPPFCLNSYEMSCRRVKIMPFFFFCFLQCWNLGNLEKVKNKLEKIEFHHVVCHFEPTVKEFCTEHYNQRMNVQSKFIPIIFSYLQYFPA